MPVCFLDRAGMAGVIAGTKDKIHLPEAFSAKYGRFDQTNCG
jgi:hypothetical protein